MKTLLSIISGLLFVSQSVFGQGGALDFFNTSHFARTVRLGNAYTGVAEGPEAIFYNASGIADSKWYGFVASSGQGLAFIIKDMSSYDFAFVYPIKGIGTAGASVNNMAFDFGGADINYSIFNLSFARKFFNELSLGITVNYYRTAYNNISISTPEDPDGSAESPTGSAFDLNLSALYDVPLTISDRDEFKIGFQIKNILNSEMSYDKIDAKERMFQNMRAGASYTFVPGFIPISGFTPVKFMAAFDAVYNGADYDFTEWQPNFGLELTFLEMLQFSFGRESEKQIKETYTFSPQHPVNRYGVGLRVPFDKILDLNFGFDLRLDYCRSDWQQIDEDEWSISFLPESVDVQENALSVGVDFKL